MLRQLIESPLVPEVVLRAGIRQIVAMRLRDESRGGPDDHTRRLMSVIAAMDAGPIAIETDAANRQHYEMPAALFERMLGPRLKYSACAWPPGVDSLAAAEDASLAQVFERARLADGQDVLELGCGWGALSLAIAERHPRSTVTAVSNSSEQARAIGERAAARGLGNLRVITADITRFSPDGTFDKIVSIEMFEHMRNHRRLLDRIAGWMRPDARLFIHVFAHARHAYFFEDAGPSDWMAREFFTGGMMPSESLLLHFQDRVKLVERWTECGDHYRRTAEAWLANLIANRREVIDVLARVHGAADARRWFARWRLFFLACAEMFGTRGGHEWVIAHYLFARRP